MDRRRFFEWISVSLTSSVVGFAVGCKGRQYAHVLNESDRDMVGSHTAGAETWEPLIQTSVTQLLGREEGSVKLNRNGSRSITSCTPRLHRERLEVTVKTINGTTPSRWNW